MNDPRRSKAVVSWNGRGPGHRAALAFTLVEVLIVVAVLAILAGTVLPAFVESGDDARDSALKHNLKVLRHQIQLFAAQHNGNWPGFGGTPAIVHLHSYSDEAGNISLSPSPSHPLGPYLPPTFTKNPFNNAYWLKASSNPASETPDHEMTEGANVVGWFYDSATGRIAANAEGTTSEGTPRVQL